MARTISIPIEFEFFSQAAEWCAGIAEVKAVHHRKNDRFTSFETHAVTIEIVSPENFKGLKQNVPTQQLPIELTASWKGTGNRGPELMNWQYEVFIVSQGKHDSERTKRIDPWVLRSEVFSPKLDRNQLLKTLNRYGAWSQSAQPVKRPKSNWSPRIVTEPELRKDISQCQWSLLQGAEKWFEKGERLETLTPRNEFPYYVHTDYLCLDAITTSITVDFLRGITFWACYRPDCRVPFAERSGKYFCSQYCAHLHGLRERREGLKSKA
jgi:hypothetical protein